MAPDWMTISKSLPRSSLKLSRSPARIRCPVLEIGRNSVRPSTTPRMSALRSRMMSMKRLDVQCGKSLIIAVVYRMPLQLL
jgi:hypothetical protein